MLKKIVTLAMAATLAVSMVACSNTASQPTATPTPAPTATPAPTPASTTVDLAAFGEKYVTDQVMPPVLDTQADMGKQILDMNYAGLSDMELEECLAYVSMMSVNNSEMVLVQAKSADDVAKVKEIFQTRIDNMLNGGTLYPETIEIWQNNAEIVENGNYVALVVSTDKDAIVEEFNGLFQ